MTHAPHELHVKLTGTGRRQLQQELLCVGVAALRPFVAKAVSPPNDVKEMCHLLYWAKQHFRKFIDSVMTVATVAVG